MKHSLCLTWSSIVFVLLAIALYKIVYSGVAEKGEYSWCYYVHSSKVTTSHIYDMHTGGMNEIVSPDARNTYVANCKLSVLYPLVAL